LDICPRSSPTEKVNLWLQASTVLVLIPKQPPSKGPVLILAAQTGFADPQMVKQTPDRRALPSMEKRSFVPEKRQAQGFFPATQKRVVFSLR